MKNKSTIEAILNFLHLVEKTKSTLRHNWIQSGRQESDAEHSWRVALLLALINDTFHLSIDLQKATTMALIHDIPELKHGDVPGFVKDINPQLHQALKSEENSAAFDVFSLLPSSQAEKYLEIFREYELGQSPEAKVVKALDKIESQLQHLESGPQYWSKEEKGSHMLHYPDEAVKNANDPNLSLLWETIQREIEKLMEIA